MVLDPVRLTVSVNHHTEGCQNVKEKAYLAFLQHSKIVTAPPTCVLWDLSSLLHLFTYCSADVSQTLKIIYGDKEDSCSSWFASSLGGYGGIDYE